MQSDNTSIQKIFEESNNAVEQRCFTVPHAIYGLKIKKGALGVLLTLFKLEDDFVYKSQNYRGWFFAADSLVARLSRLSEATVKRVKQQLKYFQLIDYRLGTRIGRNATEYKILIDQFYLVDRMLENKRLRGSNVRNTITKTITNNNNNNQSLN